MKADLIKDGKIIYDGKLNPFAVPIPQNLLLGQSILKIKKTYFLF